MDNVWDDTELIRMYEESIQEAYTQATGVTENTSTGEEKSSEAPTSSSQASSSAPPPIPRFAPPIPPNVLAMAPADQHEALSSMLMSWYMSGYHTGYYQAMADNARKN